MREWAVTMETGPPEQAAAAAGPAWTTRRIVWRASLLCLTGLSLYLLFPKLVDVVEIAEPLGGGRAGLLPRRIGAAVEANDRQFRGRRGDDRGELRRRRRVEHDEGQVHMLQEVDRALEVVVQLDLQGDRVGLEVDQAIARAVLRPRRGRHRDNRP